MRTVVAAIKGGFGRWLIVVLLVGVLLVRPGAVLSALGHEGQWSTASLSEPRANLPDFGPDPGILTATVGNVAIFASGTTRGTPSNAVDLYDRADRQWTTATLSVGRSGPSTVAIGTRILVAGGVEGSGATSRVVDVYDTQTGAWSASSLPHPWPGGEVIAVGTKALFPGSETVDVFDAATGQATTATLSPARTGAVTDVVGARVLFVGGVVGDVVSPAVDVYDTAADTWTTAALPQARSEIKIAVVDGHALIVGGLPGDLPSDTVDVYDGTTNRWGTARLSESRRGLAVAVVGDRALFAGGYTEPTRSTYQFTTAVDVYDGATGTWSTARLSQARSVFAAAAGSRALFVSRRACVFRPECPDLVDVYDGQTGAWSTTQINAPRMFSPGLVDTGNRIGGAAVSVGSQILFVGGARSVTGGGGGVYYGFSPVRTVNVYDTTTGQWSEASLSAFVYTPAIGASGTLVAFAGQNGGTVSLGPAPTSASATSASTVDVYDRSTGEWIVGSLATPRRDIGVAVVGDKAVFAGGLVRNPADKDLPTYSTQVDLYDAGTGQWSETSMPPPRKYAQISDMRTVGTRALFYSRTLQAVDVFDAATGQWSAVTLSQERSTPSVVVIGDQVVFAGGEEIHRSGYHSAAVDLYDDRTGEWHTASLSEPRAEMAVAVAGTRVVFAGGWTSPEGGVNRPSSVVDVYDAATGIWSSSTLPTQSGAYLAAAAIGTQVLVLGRDGIDVLDLATGAWTSMPSPSQAVDWQRARVFTLGATLLFASTQTSAVTLYDSATGTWTQSKSSAEPRSDLAVAVVGPEVVFAGGSSGNPSQPSATVDVYGTRTGTWRTATLAAPREKPRVAVVGTTAVVTGGRGERSAELVDVYDGATGTWTAQPLSSPRTDVAIATVGSRVLLAGGSVGRVQSDRVDIFDTGAPTPGGGRE